MEPTIKLAQQLIQQQSITPNDNGCQKLIAEQLCPLGFVQHDHSSHGITNSYYLLDQGEPMLWFVGHTDVVPTGPEQQWQHPPFSGQIDGEWLYGRGSADMKGSIAAMIIAVKQLLNTTSDFTGSIGFLITSDEEGPAKHGVKHMVEQLKQSKQPQWCLVGEPSCQDQLGDTIKIGRRGSLSATITITGKQGHIAYPQLADNPIHSALPALHALCQEVWDQGNDHFPPTSFQLSNIHAGTGATNVIPGDIVIEGNFRYAPTNNAQTLQKKTDEILQAHIKNYTIKWHHSGEPFYTKPGTLVNAMQTAIEQTCNCKPILSTSGGTSDGRFIAPLGCEIIEFGPINQTIHQIDERVSTNDLNQLSKIYQKLLESIFTIKI